MTAQYQDGAAVIREGDRADMIKLVGAMRGQRIALASELADETGLSIQRLRALVIRYQSRRFRVLGGRMEWFGGFTTSHAKDSPGIRGHAVGTSGYTPAEVAVIK